MEIKSVPEVTAKEKNKDFFLKDVKISLEMLDCKIQQMRDIKICVTN